MSLSDRSPDPGASSPDRPASADRPAPDRPSGAAGRDAGRDAAEWARMKGVAGGAPTAFTTLPSGAMPNPGETTVMQQGVWLCTAEALLYVNPACARVLDVSGERLTGGPEAVLGALHPDDRARVSAAFREALRQHRSWHAVCRLPPLGPDADDATDGAPLPAHLAQWVHLSLVPVNGADTPARSGEIAPGEGVSGEGASGRQAGAPRFIGTVRDVTAHQRLLSTLSETEGRFESLAKHLPGAVYRCTYDTQWASLFMSEGFRSICGLAPENLDPAGRSFKDVVLPEDLPRIREAVQTAVAERTSYALQYRVRDDNGRLRWVEDRGRPCFGGNGNVLWLDGVLFERTAQKRALDALARRERMIRALYRAMSDLVGLPDRDAVATRVLRLIEEAMGHTVSGVRYDDDGMLALAATTDRAATLMGPRPVRYEADGDSVVARAFRSGEAVVYDDVTSEDDFDRGLVRAAAYVPIGRYGVICVGSAEHGGIDAFDVRLLEILAHNVAGVLDRIEREADLRRARDRAEEAGRLKTAMLANMSHEIRTPLTSIIGFAEALTEGQAEDDPAKRQRFADLIHRSSLRLHDTLNAVLQLAKLEADAQTVEYERLDVVGLLREVAELRRPKAHDEGVTLTLDLPDAGDAAAGDAAASDAAANSAAADTVWAWCDAWALQRLLDNLVDNAVKFTPEGGRVTLRARPGRDASGGLAACLEVIDTGIGMSAAFQAKMYESFTQESEGMQRAYEGGGLGLAIVHRLAHLLSATLEVESAPGEGTRFIITLPALSPADLHDDVG